MEISLLEKSITLHIAFMDGVWKRELGRDWFLETVISHQVPSDSSRLVREEACQEQRDEKAQDEAPLDFPLRLLSVMGAKSQTGR